MRRENLMVILKMLKDGEILDAVTMQHVDVAYLDERNAWVFSVFSDDEWEYDDIDQCADDILKIYEHMGDTCVYDEPELFDEVASQLKGKSSGYQKCSE